jgi:anthranilate/para-aminobenzoate synthase component I
VWSEPIAFLDVMAVAGALHAEEGFAWLDSQHDHARDGRYSFLAAWPDDEIRVDFGAREPFLPLSKLGTSSDSVNVEGPRPNEVPEWIGYVAYDAFWTAPVRGTARFDRARHPVLLFRRYPALLTIDHLEDRAWLIGESQNACRTFRARLECLEPKANRPPVVSDLQADDADQHRQAIIEALAHIARGDVYEVNLARRWSAAFEGRPFGLWQAMREASRVPLGAFLDGGDHAVLACTMERFLRWEAESKRLVSRPIKGTLRRDEGDLDGPSKLQTDPKERAEHTMIVDLMRNDLGRVAKTGSVKVESALEVEPFTGLYHLVSTVGCVTRHDVDLRSIIEATFPPGSVTGAPKIRALEIIEAIEQHPRGVYCGAVGFIDRDGGLSLAVAIRTATVRSSQVEYWAGGGIVEASDPDREVAETELKARVFLKAIESFLPSTHQSGTLRWSSPKA